ncbi:hypothetical protein K438DRAFT_1761558 [Mycena galopus ATCC 62051]|nr:hypothetical protein K438DRAFT_1761558 [Mycena galopus ATCC 62051]
MTSQFGNPVMRLFTEVAGAAGDIFSRKAWPARGLRVLDPNVDFGDEDEAADKTYGSRDRAPKTSNTDKTLTVLAFIKTSFPWFSLKDLLPELFTSEDSSIRNVANTYLAMGGRLHILQTLVGENGIEDEAASDWIISMAAEICNKEASYLTDNARRAPYYEEAKSLLMTGLPNWDDMWVWS